MEVYGKVFRHKNNLFELRPYNPDKEKYYEVIKKARNEGYRQIIINSELMINLLYAILKINGFIMKITMSDNTDQDIKDNISYILSKLKHDKFLFIKLKEELEWVIDSGSIDINSVDVYFKEKRYTIYSNGIIYGEDINLIFDQVIKPVLGSYFDAQ